MKIETCLIPAKSKQFSPKQKIALVMLCTADLMSSCCTSIMAPFYPKEAAEKGMSELVSGFVFSFYSLVIFVSSPYFGKIIPKIGVKLCFIIGIITSGICCVLFGTLIFVENYTLFTILSFVIRGFEGLGSSIYCTASYVLVNKIYPQHAGFVRGVLEIFVGLGYSAGPVLGGMLYTIGGFGLPFYISGFVILLLAPMSAFFIERQETSKEVTTIPLMSFLKDPSMCITSFVIIVVSMTWSFLDPILEPHVRKFNISSMQVGLMFLLLTASYGVFSPITGWLGDKMEKYWFLIISGMTTSGLSLLFLGPSSILFFMEESLWYQIPALLVLGMSVAFALLPTYRAVEDIAIYDKDLQDNLETQSLVAGFWSSAHSLGDVIGPMTGGLLFEKFGFPRAVEVIAILNFSAASTYFFHKYSKSKIKLSLELN